MKLRTVTLSRTYNTGNYESKRVEITIEIPDDESPPLEQVRAVGWVTIQELAKEPTT